MSATATATATATPTRILDAAERLFAEHGYGEVSLRQIIRAARVNLAAVHYHFGSKTALLQEVLRRRIEPLNAERMAMLDRAEAASGRRPPAIGRVLESLMAPALRLSRDPARGGPVFMRLLGRTLMDPDEQLQGMLLQQFRDVAERFQKALRRTLPTLAADDIFWRMHFCIGAMAHTLLHRHHFRVFAGNACPPEDADRLIGRLVEFAAAGLTAPSSARRGRTQGGRR